MAYIEADKHSILRYVSSELHSPQVTTKLDVDLTKNIGEDGFFSLLDDVALDKLGQNRSLGIDESFKRLIEIFGSSSRNNHEIEVLIFACAFLSFDFLLSFGLVLNLIIFKVLGDSLFKIVNSILLQFDNLSIFHSNA